MAKLYNNIRIKTSNRGVGTEYLHQTSHPRYYINAIYPEIEPSSEDKYITTSWEDRLDLLAYDYYGDETLWWVISRANPDVTRRDSFFIKSGVQIRIPDKSIITSLLQEFEKLNAKR